jgi:predicted CopG family antitoxin
MTTCINISEDAYIKFKRIKESRPQDHTQRETFDHIIRVYEVSGKV